jgi:hypothetical protein
MEVTTRRMKAAGARRDVAFERIEGRRETYYKATLGGASQAVEIFVYTDEAGFMVDGRDWRIFERPDFASEEDLLENFLDALTAHLPQDQ